jgi:formylglycine-generating enzyme required for sulfatase activity
VLIPPGTFVMGSDETFDISIQTPAHKVTLTKAYCIDRTEVTMGAFARCVRAKQCTYDDTILGMAESYPRWPMDFVNWQDATDYCRVQGGRLPTDAEWEYAARGTDGRLYPWGNEPPTDEHWHIQPRGDSPSTVSDVGTHPKGRSFFGLDDMAGNVEEWVADACHRFSSGPVTDPKGPTDVGATCRIVRGGGWSAMNAGWARATMRFAGFRPLDRDDQTGFRCAYDPR